MINTRKKLLLKLVMALCLASSGLAAIDFSPTGEAAPTAAPAEGFAHSAIRSRWQRDDGPVASGAVSRTWMWGPGPFYTNYEPFTGLPLGNHLVQYFDKGRLEVNDPNADSSSPSFVTSGLLVREMVSGEVQTGINSFYGIGPATI